MQPQQGEAGTDDAGVPGAPTVHHSPHSHRNSHTDDTGVTCSYSTQLRSLTSHRTSHYTQALSVCHSQVSK